MADAGQAPARTKKQQPEEQKPIEFDLTGIPQHLLVFCCDSGDPSCKGCQGTGGKLPPTFGAPRATFF